LIFAERNSSPATPDSDYNFINQIRARMWKHDAVFDSCKRKS
jgi:hypothetical protein